MSKFGEMEPCRSRMEGDVIPKLVVGATGRKYHGREVVACVLPGGLFGTRKGARSRQAFLTLHNGLLNHCNIGKDGEPPTPYWAVMDGAIACKSGFTRKDVIEKAVVLVGEGKRKACEMAWDIVRNHHRHERKRDAGMSYMMDGMDGGKLVIRARDESETLQYFLAQGELAASAAASLAEPAEAPIEAEPVAAQ